MKNAGTINIMGTNSVFSRTSTDKLNDHTVMEAVLFPGTKEDKHVLPKQTTRLEVLDGKLGIMLPDRRLVVTAGHDFEIPKNTEYAFYNADEKPIRFKSILKPALHVEWLAKEIIATTQRKQSKFMSMIEYSYILNQIKGEYYRSGIPIAIQKIIHPIFAFFAKLLGVNKRVSRVN